MWNIAHQYIMKLFIIFAICYVASGQVKRLHVGATLNRLEEPRQRRLLQESDEPEIITVPRPGEEFVFISAGNNQKRGRFLEESKKKHHQSVSLFQAPSSVETGFKGVDLTSDISKTELKSEASEKIPIMSHSVSLFEAPEPFDAGFRGNGGSADIIKRETIEENSSANKELISSRTVVKTSPNGKEYEYEYLYYYDDSEEESGEEYDDVGEKQTTTTESPTTRPKRIRGKTTTEHTSENAPKASNSRGQLFVQQQSILNKSPITNLRDNSIARAIKTESGIEKSFEASSEAIDLDKNTFKKLSAKIENNPSKLKEEEINMEIQNDSIKQTQSTVQEINEEAAEISPNTENSIQKIHQAFKTININIKDDRITEKEVPVSQREDANDKETEELDISNNDKSREELIGEELHTAVEDTEIHHSAQAQDEKTHEGSDQIKPMIIHAEMMNEDEFKKKQEQEDIEPTIKPFDLENDIAKPTSSTPDEMSEILPTEAPEFERILPGTRFPARIQAKLEMMIKSPSEIITEGSADQEMVQASNGPEVLSSQNRQMDGKNEDFKKEIDEIEREAPLADDENLVETNTEPQNMERDQILGNNLLSKEIEVSEAGDPAVKGAVVEAEETILEAEEEAIQSNRINDSRAIHNLLVISQALNDDKEESSSEKEVQEDNKLPEIMEKNRLSEIETQPSQKQTPSDSDVTEATTEATTTKTKRTRFGGTRTRAPFFISRSTTRQTDIPQIEDEEKSTTARAPTTRFNRFGSRRTPTRTSTNTRTVSIAESRDEQSESTTESVLTEQTKSLRRKFRPNLFRGEQRRRKPIADDAESVTVPITFEIKRQRPILPTRNLARVSPLNRRKKTTTTTELIDLLTEMEATESPEEPVTLLELKDENETVRTSTEPNVIQDEVQEEITLRPLRRRPSIPVSERSRKSNISPVAARRLSILGRRRTTTTISPEESEQEEDNDIKIDDIQKEEVVEHESEHHETELEESEPEPVPETTTQATRLSILERNKLRRFKAKSTL